MTVKFVAAAKQEDACLSLELVFLFRHDVQMENKTVLPPGG
jgi:hypothetical protein